MLPTVPFLIRFCAKLRLSSFLKGFIGMAAILIGGSDTAFMQSLPEVLAVDLAQCGLAKDLQLSALDTQTQASVRGIDPASWMTLAITAAGAGGALTVLLGKDGFLTALARVLEKYVEAARRKYVSRRMMGVRLNCTDRSVISKNLRDLTQKTPDQER
ncbi:MAG: hypothetical protein R3E95_24170 [Thiolinea sp.]